MKLDDVKLGRNIFEVLSDRVCGGDICSDVC